MPSMPQDRLALDRASVRTTDADGHLHVAESNLSRAAVNPYYGREIPEHQSLGLRPDKVYQLLRDPAELEKSAPSFNGKPLLIAHKPQTAADHDHVLTVGAVSNVRWKAPFLAGELAVWDAAAIAVIESGEQQQLSAAYRYKAVMEPGEYQGARYDGRMTDIQANHVALVSKGRAGPDAIVGDSAIRPIHKELETMAKTAPGLSRTALFASGALRCYLRPKLAQDAKVDVGKMMAGVTGRTFKADRPKIKLALDAALKGKLAGDADLSDVDELLDELQEAINDVADDPEPKAGPAAAGPVEDDEAETGEEKKARLAKRAADKAARDETPGARQAREAAEAKATAEKDKDMITKPAMDAAIAAAVGAARSQAVAHMNAIRAAEDTVRPYVGTLVAMDSADAVYKFGLDHLTAQGHPVDLAGVPPAAFAALFAAVAPMASAAAVTAAARSPRVAMDAAGAKAFAERFPNANRLQKH